MTTHTASVSQLTGPLQDAYHYALAALPPKDAPRESVWGHYAGPTSKYGSDALDALSLTREVPLTERRWTAGWLTLAVRAARAAGCDIFLPATAMDWSVKALRARAMGTLAALEGFARRNCADAYRGLTYEQILSWPKGYLTTAERDEMERAMRTAGIEDDRS